MQPAVMIEADDVQLSLLQHNAWEAFPQLTVTHLRKLLSYLEIPHSGRKPTMIEAIKLLACHIPPHATVDELAAIIAKRLDMTTKRYRLQSHLDGNAEYVLDRLHPDDVADVKEELHELGKSTRRKALQGLAAMPRRRLPPRSARM